MTELDQAIADYERRLAEWEPKETLDKAVSVLRTAKATIELFAKSNAPDAEPKRPRAKRQPNCVVCGKTFSQHRGIDQKCPGGEGTTYEVQS